MEKENLSLEEKEKAFYNINNRGLNSTNDFKYKICAYPMQVNVTQECYRDQLVSYFQMYPLIEKSVSMQEADYIIYANPYARIQDFTKNVLEDLENITQERKDNAEIIIVGKAVNIKDIIGDKYENITYVPSHYTEYLGKRFGIDMNESYFVYDERLGQLNIWPVDGCLNKCGFCRRTYMNIPFESLPLEYIKEKLDEIKKNNPEQLKTISLRAENLTEYGLDLYGKQRLNEVIDLLNSYDEIKKIELPIGMCIGEITDEILESICNCKKITAICINLEAGSDRLLKLINKKHTNERAKEICNRIYESNPIIGMRTTVMLGLPTEGLEDILELSKLIIDCKFNYVHCNYYGSSPKHPIAKYPQINDKVRELHLKYLITLLKKNYNNKFILTMLHEKILDKSKRSVIRELEKIKVLQEKTLPRVYIGIHENFIGNNISIKTNDRLGIYKMFANNSFSTEVNRIKEAQRISKENEERQKAMRLTR